MDQEEAKKCFLKIRCKKCGTIHLIEFWKPFARSRCPLSHPFSDIPTIRSLCKYCFEDLKRNGVRLEEVD